jgi:hypothetical protein
MNDRQQDEDAPYYWNKEPNAWKSHIVFKILFKAHHPSLIDDCELELTYDILYQNSEGPQSFIHLFKEILLVTQG